MTGFLRILVPAGTRGLLLSDALLISCAFVATVYIALPADPKVYLLHDGGLARIALVLLTILASLRFNGMYSEARVTSWIDLAQRLCLVMGFTLLSQGLIGYLVPRWHLPIRLMSWGSLVATVALFVLRTVWGAFYAWRSDSRPVDRML
jgi:hypothetical protein